MSSDPPRPAGRLGWLVAALLYAAGFCLLFRSWLLPGPLRTFGDDGDGVIAISILEHWWQWFRGEALGWDMPRWYWPAPHPLAYTDSLFLLSLPYAASRWLGASIFASYDAVVAVLGTIGFWSFVALLRRGAVAVGIAGVFAFVFSFGAVTVFKLFHVQLYTLQLAPVLGLLLVDAWSGTYRPVRAFACGLLFGLMTFTSAQTPWFLGLESGLAALMAACVVPGSWAAIWRHRQRAGAVAGWTVLGLIGGLLPVAALYRNAAGVSRRWDEVSYYAPHWPDLLHSPSGSWLWSPLWTRLGIFRPHGIDIELALGLTPVLALAALAGAIFALWQVRRTRAGLCGAIMVGCLLAGLLGPLGAVKLGEHSLWYLVFELVPGGHSVRTPFRIELSALFLLCVGLSLATADALRLARREHRPRWVAGLIAVMALIVAEQPGAPARTTDLAERQDWLLALRRPDFPCSAFYLLPKTTEAWQDYQSDAMIAAQTLGLATLGGNSSFFPAGWALNRTDQPGYAARVLAWIDEHGPADVCGADPRAGRWEPGTAALQP